MKSTTERARVRERERDREKRMAESEIGCHSYQSRGEEGIKSWREMRLFSYRIFCSKQLTSYLMIKMTET